MVEYSWVMYFIAIAMSIFSFVSISIFGYQVAVGVLLMSLMFLAFSYYAFIQK